MWTRLAVLGGAGAVGFPWLMNILETSLPAESFRSIPSGAQVTFMSVLFFLGFAFVASAVFSFLMLLIGDRR